MKVKFSGSPLTAPSSCFYFCCSRLINVWPICRLKIVTWFVVKHFAWSLQTHELIQTRVNELQLRKRSILKVRYRYIYSQYYYYYYYYAEPSVRFHHCWCHLAFWKEKLSADLFTASDQLSRANHYKEHVRVNAPNMIPQHARALKDVVCFRIMYDNSTLKTVLRERPIV